ncbi:MAG: hypothetical protein UZ21_OP11001001139 [Microgenomates bacterium OLB22]|nr:MAG: hypothetical protein UZ21_OP11001001139 [Microgenomates bacterium OLB22]
MLKGAVMSRERNRLGSISLIGTFLLLCYLVFRMDTLGIVLAELRLFLTGHAFSIPTGFSSLRAMMSIVLPVVVLGIGASIVAITIPYALYGKPGGHKLNELLDELVPGFHLINFFILVVLEELFARYLFFGPSS